MGADRLGAEAFGLDDGRLDGAGRTLGGVRLEEPGRALGTGARVVAGRTLTLGGVARVVFGFAVRVGVLRVVGTSVRVPVRVPGRIAVVLVSSRGRARRASSVVPPVPVPRLLSVARALRGSSL
ncbi:MAG: hypothetical protein F4X60_09940 [Gemmatimonadetes bacterium]|nr:hypothetical protein [Gemmatimonadota bacterium]MYB98861.1 hypothetical protein [Gemmatimonadota bacterium]